METKELKPNDVAVILRPTFENGEWTQEFEVLVTGFGPITMRKEDMDQMIGMGVLLASVVPLMDSDEEFTKMVTEHCNKFYGDLGEFQYDPNHDSFNDKFTLSVDTKTQGGIQ